MRARSVILTLVLIACLQTHANAQTPKSFFPHHAGDMWEYSWTAEDFHTLKVNVIFDCTALNGCSYITTYDRFISPPPHPWTPYTFYYVVDTLHQVFQSLRGWNDTIDKRKLYQLDAGIGQQWVVWDFGCGGVLR